MSSAALILNLIVRDQGTTAIAGINTGFLGLGSTVGGLTKTMLGLGAAMTGIAAGMKAPIDKAADFDQTIRQIGAATDVPAEGL